MPLDGTRLQHTVSHGLQVRTIAFAIEYSHFLTSLHCRTRSPPVCLPAVGDELTQRCETSCKKLVNDSPQAYVANRASQSRH